MTGDSNWSSVVTLIHFDGANTSTTFHDSSLSNHTIAESFGGQITTSFAAFGTGSADFVTNHGSGPCIYVSPNSTADFQFGSGQFTVECWVYPTGSNPNGYIMHTGLQSASVGWGLFYDSSTTTLYFIYSTDGSTLIDIDGPCALALDTWTHVAADYDGTTCRVYADGVVIASSTLSGAIYATTQDIAFGNDNNSDTNTWNGYIDEARVTKGVARYAGAFTAPTAAFPAYGTSPQPESGGGAGLGNATNASITYDVTTWEPNDILVVAVFNENHGTGNPATVASITSSGLTFAQRSIVSATDGAGMEVWWALAASPLIAQSLTIAFTGSFDDASSVAYGVAGCATGSPWDGNGSLPATASGFSITGVSTTSANDCLVTFVGSETGPGNPFGYIVLVATDTFGGSLASAITTGYQDVSSTQSSISLSAATGSFPAFIVDALTADITEVDDSPSITGVAGTGAAGTILMQGIAPLTGVACTGSAGTPGIEVDCSKSIVGAGGSGQAGQIGGGIPFTTGVSGYGTASVTQTALVGDPSWTVTGTWYTDNGTPTSQERIFTDVSASTYIQASFSGDQLAVTVQTSAGWGDLGIYAADNSTLLYTVTCSTDTGGQLATTVINGFGAGTETIFLRKTTNDGLFVVLVSLAWQVSSVIAADTITLTGASGSGAAGTIVLTAFASLVGVATSGSAGTTIAQDSIAVAGVSATGAAGTIKLTASQVSQTFMEAIAANPNPPVDVAQTMMEAIAANPNPPVFVAQLFMEAVVSTNPAPAAPSGVAGTGQVGAPQDQIGAIVSGVATAGATGTVTPIGGTIVILSSVFGSGHAGTPQIKVDANSVGVAGTGAAGGATPGYNESTSISGVETDSAVGLQVPNPYGVAIGIAHTGHAGTFGFQITSTLSLIGVSGTAQIGSAIANDATAGPVTWDPHNLGSTASLSSDFFTFTVPVIGGIAVTAGARSTTSYSTGKRYFEVTWTGPDLIAFVGIANASWQVNATTDLGWDNNSLAQYVTDATVLNGTVLVPAGIGEVPGSVYGIAVDFGAQLIWVTATQMRNVAGFNWNNSATANPATAVGGTSFSSMNAGPYFIAGELSGSGSASANLVLNAGNSGFTFPIPAGFVAWDTSGIGVAGIGGVGTITIQPTATGVFGTGFAADGGIGHDRRSNAVPAVPEVSLAISGVSGVGVANPISTGFLTSGAYILANSNYFVFKGVNFWQGYANPGTFAGLPFISWQNNLNAIKSLGFNTVRLGMFMAGILDPTDNWPLCSSGAGNIFVNGLNTDLVGLNTLQFYDLVVDYCASIGLYVVADMHSTMGGISTGFTTSGEFTLTASPSTWSADGYTDTDFINAWTTLATRWAGKPAFVACDLMNEPLGPGTTFTQWGPGPGVDLHDLYTRTGNAIHAAIQTVNPTYGLPLIVCQTQNSDFSNVPTYPLALTVPNKAVYAPHVYPSPLANGYPASGGVDNGTGAMAGWNAAWGFLATTNEAPIYVTAFGGTLASAFPDQAAYWATITPYMLGTSGYSGAPTAPSNWTVSNWDAVEGTIIGEDATGIVNGIQFPRRPTFYPTLLPYIQELIGASPTSAIGVSGTGGVGSLQDTTLQVGVGGVAGSGATGARLGRGGNVVADVNASVAGVATLGIAGFISFFGLHHLTVVPTGVSASGQAGIATGQTAIPGVVGLGQAGTPQAQYFAAIAVTGAGGTGLAGSISHALFIVGMATFGAVGLETVRVQVCLGGVTGAGIAARAGLVARSKQAVMMIAQ